MGVIVPQADYTVGQNSGYLLAKPQKNYENP
jgi:hypothetical protein